MVERGGARAGNQPMVAQLRRELRGHLDRDKKARRKTKARGRAQHVARGRARSRSVLSSWNSFLLIQGSVSKMSSAAPRGHNWTRSQSTADENIEDPVDQMISRTGCIAFHHAVQDCMAEHQDWRKCQAQVKAFKECMSQYQKNRLEELQRRQKQIPTDG